MELNVEAGAGIRTGQRFAHLTGSLTVLHMLFLANAGGSQSLESKGGHVVGLLVSQADRLSMGEY